MLVLKTLNFKEAIIINKHSFVFIGHFLLHVISTFLDERCESQNVKFEKENRQIAFFNFFFP